jgi:two-component sensor histidine kinase
MRTLLLSLLLWLTLFSCIGQTPADTALAHSYETAAAATFASGDYEKSMEFFSKAFPYLQKDPALIAAPGILLTHAVRILIQQQLPSEALGILRAIDIPAVAAKHDNIDPEQIILGKGDCFYAMNEPDSAQRYYRDAMQYVPNPGFSQYKVVGYEALANFYVGTHQYARARPLLDTLTASANRAATPLATRAMAWFKLYQIDSATQNFREALIHLRQYQRLQDTLANVIKSRELAEMDTLFETEKKMQRVANQDAQAALQTQLAKSTQRKNILLVSTIFLLLALAAIGYSRYQLRRRLAANQQALEENIKTHQTEKAQLHREAHQHAINQLQTIITLLHAPSDPDKLRKTDQHRPAALHVALTLAHKHLSSASPETTTIDMREYIRELINSIRQNHPLQRPIVWRLDLSAIILPTTQTLPLGIILETAITNAIRHAFCTTTVPSPTIHVSLKAESENNLTLLIADNGIGLPAGIDPSNPTTSGLKIIQTLTHELHGVAEVINKEGLSITIRYPYR